LYLIVMHPPFASAVACSPGIVGFLPLAVSAGLSSVPEESVLGLSSNSSSSRPPAATSNDLVSPLLLLDALKINLHLEPADNVSGATGRYSRGSPADSDEESDAGYDPSASEPGQAGRGIGLNISSDSDTDDEEDEQLQQLTKVTLLAARELPGRFWACHDQGSWGINIKWLQQLNSSADTQGLFGSASGSSSGGWEQQLQQQQDAQPPAPVLQELLVSGPGIISSCVVGNALSGSGCVVLEKGEGPQLVFLKPRPTGVLGEGVVGGEEGAAAAAGDAGADDGDELGVAELLLTPGELDTRAKQQVRGWHEQMC
jgi:hypothetical protein